MRQIVIVFGIKVRFHMRRYEPSDIWCCIKKSIRHPCSKTLMLVVVRIITRVTFGIDKSFGVWFAYIVF